MMDESERIKTLRKILESVSFSDSQLSSTFFTSALDMHRSMRMVDDVTATTQPTDRKNIMQNLIQFLQQIHAGFIAFSAVTTPQFAGGKKTIRNLTNGESDEIFRVVFARGLAGAKWENVVANAAKREGTENDEKYQLSKTPIRWVAGALAKHYLEEKYYLRLVHPKVFRERYFYRRQDGTIVNLDIDLVKANLYKAPVSKKVAEYVGSDDVPQFRHYSLENIRSLHAQGFRFRMV